MRKPDWFYNDQFRDNGHAPTLLRANRKASDMIAMARDLRYYAPPNSVRHLPSCTPLFAMDDQEFAGLLHERIKEIAREVFKEEVASHNGSQPPESDDSEKLRAQLSVIKAKEHLTVKEAALLLGCSDSHVRKLVNLARKGKSRHPIPFVDLDGPTVFPLLALLDWASPRSQLQIVKDEAA
jgi:hypothetical protein